MTSKEHLEHAVSEYNLFHFSEGDFHRHAFLREQILGGKNALVLSVPKVCFYSVDIPSKGLDSFEEAEEKHYKELLDRMLLLAMDIKTEI